MTVVINFKICDNAKDEILNVPLKQFIQTKENSLATNNRNCERCLRTSLPCRCNQSCVYR